MLITATSVSQNFQVRLITIVGLCSKFSLFNFSSGKKTNRTETLMKMAFNAN